MKDETSAETRWTRRDFLRTVGVSVPTLSLMQSAVVGADAAAHVVAYDRQKFTPVDLSRYFNCSSSDFGPHTQAQRLSGETARDGLTLTPAGDQQFRGVPFHLANEGVHDKRWVMLSSRSSPNGSRSVRIPVEKSASYLCMLAFCDWDKNEQAPPDLDAYEQVGQHLADLVFVYEGGREETLPIRRRFEVSSPSVSWGHFNYTCLACREEGVRSLTDPLANGEDWGRLQMAIGFNSTVGPWLSALQSPSQTIV